jgi:hypothetical protein
MTSPQWEWNLRPLACYNLGQKFVERLNVCASFPLNLFLLHFISMTIPPALPIQCYFCHSIVVSDLQLLLVTLNDIEWGEENDI